MRERIPFASRLARSPLGRSALLLTLLLALATATTPGFLRLELRDGRLFGTLVDVVHRSTPTALVALGMTLVIGTGGIDLSVGSVMAIAATLAATCVRDGSASAFAAVAAALAAGATAGLFNGALVAFVRLQPIVATLILYTAGRGIAQLLSHGTIVTFDSAGMSALGSGAWLALPATTWIVFATLALLAFVARRTSFGLYLQAYGDNPRAAFVAGLPVTALVLATYALCSTLAAFAGVLAAADIRAGDPSSAGLYIELDAILAVVVGGTALRGGKVSLAGTLLGTWTLQTLNTLVLMHGARLDLALVVKATAVLIVVAAQSPKLRELLRAKHGIRA